MSDVEIRLERGNEVLATTEGSYEDFALMESRSIVNKATTALSRDIAKDHYKIVLDDRNRRDITQRFALLSSEGEQVRHQIEINVEKVVREWRNLL